MVAIKDSTWMEKKFHNVLEQGFRCNFMQVPGVNFHTGSTSWPILVTVMVIMWTEVLKTSLDFYGCF